MRILAGATTALRRIVDLGLIGLIVIVLFGVILGKGAQLVGRQSIVIGGGSMEPTIALGAAILVKPVVPSALMVGDVVSMQVGPERTMYTHRIVAVLDRADGRWIRTKGDANAAPDTTLVPVSAVVGRVEFVFPLVGYLLALLSLPMGVMFVLGLAATLLAIAWLLESLEAEPRPERRQGAVDATEPSPGAIGSALSPWPPGIQPELLRGEPIAARPATAAFPGGPSTWAVDVSSVEPTGEVRVARPTVARPTVREQLVRSREVRRRRAQWLTAGQPDRHAAD